MADWSVILIVTVPMAAVWLLVNRPHQRYLRPRVFAVLCWFAVTGIVGVLLPGTAGVLVAVTGALPVVGEQLATRRCSRASAAGDGELLARRTRTLERWSWPVPGTPHALFFRHASAELLDEELPADDDWHRGRRTPIADLWATLDTGRITEYRQQALAMLGTHSGPLEQAVAVRALAAFDLDQAVKWWASSAARRARAHSPLTAVALLASAGRVADVRSLAATAGATVVSRASLLAEALIASGADPEPVLEELRSHGPAGVRSAARLIALNVAPPNGLSAEATAVLDRLPQAIQNSVHAWGSDRGRWQPRVTWAIAAVLSVVFAVQLTQGFDEQNLYDMGAYVTGNAPSEWWRSFTAALLHGSVEHFVLNAVALLSLGRLAEARVQRRVFLSTWVCASVLSFALYDLFDRSSQPGLAVGASGGVMGLLGVSLAVFVVNQIRHPSPVNSRLLLVFGLLTVVQVVMDQFVPNVAWQAHLIGLATGLAIGVRGGLSSRPTSA